MPDGKRIVRQRTGGTLHSFERDQTNRLLHPDVIGIAAPSGMVAADNPPALPGLRHLFGAGRFRFCKHLPSGRRRHAGSIRTKMATRRLLYVQAR
jgi:hypothetical protein